MKNLDIGRLSCIELKSELDSLPFAAGVLGLPVARSSRGSRYGLFDFFREPIS